MARGTHIFFLDGHCKPRPGYMQHLLSLMGDNYKRIVVPLVPDVNEATWEDTKAVGAKMMFDWTFYFDWFDDGLPEVPILSGGILLMSRRAAAGCAELRALKYVRESWCRGLGLPKS